MGRASARRRRSRQKYLRKSAARDPEKFRSQWAKRLASWSDLARQHADTLVDPDGRSAPRAFDMVGHAMAELAACGDAAVELEADTTLEVMNNQCCKAVAAVVDHRLHRLSNAHYRIQAGLRQTSR